MSTVMGTANGSAASMSPGPSLAVTSHFSSSPVGSSAATASLQPSSTSGTTEQDLTATSHPSTVLVSSTPSSTHDSMSVGPGAVTVATTEHSPSPSTPSPKPLASTSGTSLASDATQANLWSSTALTQGQGTVEGRTTSSSTESSSSATAPDSVASHATTGLAEGSSCVPVTVSIQLEKVTSTMIQFRWKPEGGTRDGPYRVRLWGGSREMWNGSLNETSTAFKNLLSDNEYQISVDVTTCSKNISTSLTVRTAAEVFNGTTRITNKDFIPEYQNKSSAAFKEFETKFINEIKKHLPQKIQELINGTKMHIEINSLKNGSVIVIFNIVMDIGENITKTEISDAFTGALNMSTVLQADLRKTVIQARNSCQPGLNDCSQNATCTAEGATYSCQCNKGFTDNSPQVPGRVCQRKQNLPSEQMTTVLPKNATAIFTRSTANSGFTTTFSPAPCMPVSIKVQNVTGEEIQFSWTSDRRGSLYTISLVDGNKEINRTTTKETKAVFKRLLPGHLYTVFVAVSSCAENSWTSFRVRTDPVSCLNRTEFCLPQNTGCSDLKYTVCSYYQAFACSVLLKNQTFNHALYNSDSEGYKKMSESIKTEVVREMRIKLEDDHFDIIVLGFRPGSVIAYFISLLQNQEPIDVNIFQAHLNQVLRSKFGDQTEVTVKSLTAQSSTENSSAWKVAVIVLGVLLGVALVLILLVSLVYIYMKKRSGTYERRVLNMTCSPFSSM
ncbi:PREDICTED: cell wall protein DAN4-like isoform X2 [Calidris pugnax]|uniref:cell wall protein DAN4-like isoform X2 n=1 Tax=Calidris pugnax TaxID=198806 RepID=UPI00071C2B3A|nr:PREDICTED: cell wall protein DAN4-like isoform X2 [Calidris pugnax]